MTFYVMTLFPEMIEILSSFSIIKRGIDSGYISIEAVNIRDFAGNKHNSVDDYTYGGGAGMLMQAEPVFSCYESIINRVNKELPVIYLTPRGKTFNQKIAGNISNMGDMILLCGHYEGIDERVIEKIVTHEISIGDYVLTGGELPAMVLIDSVSRLIPGVLHNTESAGMESFENNLLEYPQYTRPAVWRGMEVPQILLSGDHAKVDKWRSEQAYNMTQNKRPDLLK